MKVRHYTRHASAFATEYFYACFAIRSFFKAKKKAYAAVICMHEIERPLDVQMCRIWYIVAVDTEKVTFRLYSALQFALSHK